MNLAWRQIKQIITCIILVCVAVVLLHMGYVQIGLHDQAAVGYTITGITLLIIAIFVFHADDIPVV